MNPPGLLNWMLLSTGLLGTWWLCYRLALRGERSFAYNRAFLGLGPVLAAGLPLLPLAWPAGWAAAPATLLGVTHVLLPAIEVRAAGAATEAPAPNWAVWLGAGYAAGVVLLLGRLGLGLVRLWWATRGLSGEKCVGYTLVRTHGRLPTSSFGRAVLWDETRPLSPAEAAQVLRHELAHVRQGHTYDRLLLELLRAALWFNPFVHLCGRALALTHEYLADEAALRHAAAAAPAFSPTHSYARLLARQVAGRLGFSVPLAHSFSHSQTLRRIAMIQKTSPIRRWKQWLVLPVAAVLFVIVAGGRTAAQGGPVPVPKPNAVLPEGTPPPPPRLAREGDAPLQSSPPVYTYVEKMPQLPGGGGNKAIVEYIQSKLVYPSAAQADRKQGRVFVSFVVMKDGNVQDVKIIKGLAAAYDAAVVAAVQQLPRFIPGTQNSKAVNVSFTVPISIAN
ncbi:TonB family protein [Hymenobacter sp.]|uniref:TonB family protein n=1 Tax=Hymenobacter sp. TaxID=1898978 RepID=UPI002869F57F|nr:TonB family protein [Hymenobacter sp.]